jgi:hypothetical protein
MAWGEAPVIVPTTAWYVTEVAVLLVTDAEHVVPFPQDATALLLLSRITMYHGVEVMSPLAVATRRTAVPRVALVALAASVTEKAATGVTANEGLETAPVPALLVALTVKV